MNHGGNRNTWLNKNVLVATAFVFGAHYASLAARSAAEYIINPMNARAAVDAAVARQVLDRTGQFVTCRGPDRGWRDWQETGGRPVCYSSEPELRVPLAAGTGETAENFRAIAYASAYGDEPFVVLSASANRLVRLHEGRHWSRRPLAGATSSVDRVIIHTYGEADAFLTEIVAAYQNYLQTGETEEWDNINMRAPYMVRVFDALVADSPRAQAMLRRGEMPPDRILRQTAASYLFSQGARAYVENYYAEMYPDLKERLENGAVNVTTRQLNNWLHFDGRHYLVTENGQAFDPLNRWILHETLGVALPDNLQRLADYYEAERLRLSDALVNTREGTDEHAELLAKQQDNESRSPASRAWQAAGLQDFRSSMPVLTQPAVPAPTNRARIVVLRDEQHMASVMRMQAMPPGPVHTTPCNLYQLAKVGRC